MSTRREKAEAELAEHKRGVGPCPTCHDTADEQERAARDHAIAETARRLYDATPEEMHVRVQAAEPAGPYGAALYDLLAVLREGGG